jgi:hypothetical protein
MDLKIPNISKIAGVRMSYRINYFNLLIINTLPIIFSLCILSCIDRDTITGTGKQEPDRIVGTGGSLQTGGVTSTLQHPLSVQVIDAKTKPVRNIRVEFVAVNGNASFSDTIAVTDADGYATTRVTLGKTAGAIIVNAVLLGVKGSPVLFTLTAVSSGADGIFIVSGDGQNQTVGMQLLNPLVVGVVDKFNNPIIGLPVYFSVSSGSGSTMPDVSFTDSAGFASAFWTVDTLIGIQHSEARILVSLASYVSFTAQATADDPIKLEKRSPDTIYTLQSKTVSNAFDVRVRDKYNNVVAVVPVGFQVTEGDGAVIPQVVTTGVNGTAATTFVAGMFDSINTIEAHNSQIPSKAIFKAKVYKNMQIDSLKSSGGIVTLWWQQNLNYDFISFELQRCDNYLFDNTTLTVKTLNDFYARSTTDSSVIIGTSPYYRLKVNCNSSFYFLTNIRQITVGP